MDPTTTDLLLCILGLLNLVWIVLLWRAQVRIAYLKRGNRDLATKLLEMSVRTRPV